MISCVFSLQSYIYLEELIMGGILLILRRKLAPYTNKRLSLLGEHNAFHLLYTNLGGKNT